MATSDKCDMQAVKGALFSIEFDIKNYAKDGETKLQKELQVYVSKERRCATYAKILKILKKKGYKANIQTEIRYYINEKSAMTKYLREHGEPVRGVPYSNTYLYISWGKEKNE